MITKQTLFASVVIVRFVASYLSREVVDELGMSLVSYSDGSSVLSVSLGLWPLPFVVCSCLRLQLFSGAARAIKSNIPNTFVACRVLMFDSIFWVLTCGLQSIEEQATRSPSRLVQARLGLPLFFVHPGMFARS